MRMKRIFIAFTLITAVTTFFASQILELTPTDATITNANIPKFPGIAISAPQISGIDPTPPMYQTNTKQWLFINGTGFAAQCSCNLTDPNGKIWPVSAEYTRFVASSQIQVYVGLFKSGDWKAIIINPDNGVSNLYSFNVATRENKLDSELVGLINTYAPTYYKDTWGMTISQYKAWIALISLREPGIGRYGAHSQYGQQSVGRTDGDCFNHKDIPELFSFSTGIGPFQLDNGGNSGGPNENWTTMTTLDKMKPDSSLLSTLRWHRDKFGAGSTLANFSAASIWFAVAPTNEDAFKTTWLDMTGQTWDSCKTTKKTVNFNPPTLTNHDPLSNVQHYIGKVRWAFPPEFSGNFDTWIISARNWEGEVVDSYFYTYNSENETWVYNDYQGQFNHYFKRNYKTTQFPDGRIAGNPKALAGDTYTSAIITYPSTTQNSIERVSVDTLGNQSNGDSSDTGISADGRYVAFSSSATNLVLGDTNNKADVFVRDRQTNTTTRVSVDSNGNQGNWGSGEPSISADGRFIAFSSTATNLVPGGTPNFWNVFLRDQSSNNTTLISLDSNNIRGNNGSFQPSISADGRYIAFASYATNLVPQDTNSNCDVFIRDRQNNTTARVSVDSSGNQGNDWSSWPSISADGRYIAFISDATNLVQGDTNGPSWQGRDVFVRDLQTNTTARVSVDSNGNQSTGPSYIPKISANGRYIAFESPDDNLVIPNENGSADIFVRDLQINTTTRVSVDSNGTEGNDNSDNPSISADGQYIAFESVATNLVSEDSNGSSDIFIRDRQSNTTIMISVDSDGNQDNNSSTLPSISANGHDVAFISSATNLVPGDTNGAKDVFVATLPTAAVTPAINNTAGASCIGTTTAILNGDLTSDGGEPTTIHIYGGTTDGGTNPTKWEHDEILENCHTGAFYYVITGLTPNKIYYYRCSATNSANTAWAPETTSFITKSVWAYYWEGPGKDWWWFSSGAPR